MRGPAEPTPGGQAFPRLSPWLLSLAALSALICLATMTIFKMSNNDIWLHITTGNWILEHGRVPDHDRFSFLSTGRPFVAHEWLSGVAFSLVYSLAGVNGLIFFKAACLAGAVALHFATARELRGRVSVFLPLLAVVLYIGGERFIERPHIFTFLLTAAYLWLLVRFRGRNHLGYVWVILPLHVVWVNLHGGWVQGVALLAAFAFGETLRRARARRPTGPAGPALDRRHLLHLIGVVIACVPATLLNPFGARALLLPFELTSMKTFMERIYEWHPPFAPSFNDTTMFALYLVLVIAFVTAFHLAGTQGPVGGGGWLPSGLPARAAAAAPLLVGCALLGLRLPASGALWRPEVLRPALLLLLAVFLLSVAINWRTVDLGQAALFVLFYSLSLRHNRAVADAALVLLPLTVASISVLLERRRLAAAAPRPGRKPTRGSALEATATPLASETDRQDWSGPLGIALGSAVLLALATSVLAFDYFYDFAGSRREKGLGVASTVPTAAVDFVADNQIAGNAFVSYALAAPLLHRRFPAVKVNMDSRNEVYGEQAYLEYERALQSGAALKTYLAQHPVDFFLLDQDHCSPELLRSLQDGDSWALVYRDEQACILLRNVTENKATISRYAGALRRPRATLTFPESQGGPPAR